jgi:3D (Asp-Asp-Asp) domain-containing protein
MRFRIFILAIIISLSIKFAVTQQGSSIQIWGTYYYTPKFSSVDNGVHLRDLNGKSLGIQLSLNDWCSCAMEGSCSVDGIIFNFVKTTRSHYVDCSRFFRHRPSGYAKFKIVESKYGLGVNNIQLIPFKSVAVDRKSIPINSKIFIPAAKGVLYEFEGEILEHDGIFYAHDVGGLIKNNHIDFFIGLIKGKPSEKNPFEFIKSNPRFTTSAYVLK